MNNPPVPAQNAVSDLVYLQEARSAVSVLLQRCCAGFQDREMLVDCDDRGLKAQSDGFLPVVERSFHAPMDTSKPLESFK